MVQQWLSTFREVLHGKHSQDGAPRKCATCVIVCGAYQPTVAVGARNPKN